MDKCIKCGDRYTIYSSSYICDTCSVRTSAQSGSLEDFIGDLLSEAYEPENTTSYHNDSKPSIEQYGTVTKRMYLKIL